MVRTTSVWFVVLLLALGAAAQTERKTSAPERGNVGKIKGVVLDKNDARVAGARVGISNAKSRRAVASNEEGEFEVELPAGVYRVRVKANGFRAFVLWPFEVKPGVTETIDVHLEVATSPGLVPAVEPDPPAHSSAKTGAKVAPSKPW
ncbi:MAG TPA: carboxypeptidase-like regulatory domain-containing protein [Pyrinomonadaceae bacterium]